MIIKILTALAITYVEMWISVSIICWAFDYPYSIKLVLGVWVIYILVRDLLADIGSNRK